DRRGDRPLRLRQVHPAAPRRRPGPPQRRHHRPRRHAADRHRSAHRGRLPGTAPAALAHPRPERRPRPAPQHRPTRRARAGAPPAAARRARARRGPPPPRGLRRHGPARLDRPAAGPQPRRAAAARAARRAEVLLLDEPFGALDALTRLRMQDLLLEIHAAEPTTVLVVTHDVEEALYLADRVVQLRSLRDAAPGAPSLARTVEVPGARPRDRPDHDLAALRAELLEGLGVHSPRPTTSEDHS